MAAKQFIIFIGVLCLLVSTTHASGVISSACKMVIDRPDLPENDDLVALAQELSQQVADGKVVDSLPHRIIYILLPGDVHCNLMQPSDEDDRVQMQQFNAIGCIYNDEAQPTNIVCIFDK